MKLQNVEKRFESKTAFCDMLVLCLGFLCNSSVEISKYSSFGAG